MAEETALKVGARVLAFHGPLIYEAKVLRVHEKNKTYIDSSEGHLAVDDGFPQALYDQNAYFLHYKGWKPKWDEWVPLDRVLDYNEQNLALQKDLKLNSRRPKPVKEELPALKKRAKLTGPAEQPAPKRRLAAKDSLVGAKLIHDISFKLLHKLRCFLVDDWEFITKDRKLVDIPSSNSVSGILHDYLKSRPDLPEIKAVSTEFVAGLELYFNKLLGLVLLYKHERYQYLNVIKEYGSTNEEASFRPVDFYGVEHLLRLLISLPALISQTAMDAVSVNVMGTEAQKMLEFVDENLHRYVNEYETATPAYERLSRGL